MHASLFVSDAVHEREITLDGEKHILHFREIASEELRKMQTAKDGEEHAVASRIIAKSLCNPDGTDAITPADAAKLKHGVRMAIAVAIAEVNGIGANVGKVSPPEEKTGSGTS